MNKLSTSKICRAGVVASVYFVLTYFFQAISFGPIQLRVAEALTVLPLFFFELAPALFIGCFLANFMSGFGVYDLFIGSFATLIASFLTYFIGKWLKNKYLRFFIGVIPPIVINALLIPLVIYLSGGLEFTYFIQAVVIGAEQTLAIVPLGGFLYSYLTRLKEKNPDSPLFRYILRREKMKKLTFLLLLVALFSVTLTGCASSGESHNPKESVGESIELSSDKESFVESLESQNKKFTVKKTLVLKYQADSSTADYNDTILAKMYLVTICVYSYSEETIEKANVLYAEKGGEGEILTKNASAECVEDSLLLTLSYKDETEEIAMKKLEAIIEVLLAEVNEREVFSDTVELVLLS